MKINERGEKMVEHHVKYKELHGVDETVWMTVREHKLLHMKLRREGKCTVSSGKLKKISGAARNRTQKVRDYARKRYEENIEEIRKERREYSRKYYEENKEKVSIRKKKYYEENKERITEQKRKYQKEYRERKKREKEMI